MTDKMDTAHVGSPGHRLGVLFAAAELYPLIKTGGLADVCAALPSALVRPGAEVRAVLPGYVPALDTLRDKRTLGRGPGGGMLLLGRTQDTDLPVYLLDWPDNLRRFANFCRTAAHLAREGDGWGRQPDVVHADDWHTGLLPALLALHPGPRPPCLFTVHNLAFQGNFRSTPHGPLACRSRC